MKRWEQIVFPLGTWSFRACLGGNHDPKAVQVTVARADASAGRSAQFFLDWVE